MAGQLCPIGARARGGDAVTTSRRRHDRVEQSPPITVVMPTAPPVLTARAARALLRLLCKEEFKGREVGSGPAGFGHRDDQRRAAA